MKNMEARGNRSGRVLLTGDSHRRYIAEQQTNHSSAGEKRKTIEESYQRIADDSRSFDVHFWQSQGPCAIFEAVSEMLRDYFLIRGKDADEFRLQRTIESFRKA